MYLHLPLLVLCRLRHAQVSAVSAKLDSILGDASNGSRPKARSMATSLGERLMDLTERSLALCGMNGIEREVDQNEQHHI